MLDSLLHSPMVSYKGISFYTKKTTEEYGRNVQVVNLLKRSQPFTTSLSKLASRYEFEGFFIGNNLQEQKNKLIEAVLEDKYGILESPEIAPINVWCEPPLQFTTDTENRILRFSIKFVEAGDKDEIKLVSVQHHPKNLIESLNASLDLLIDSLLVPSMLMDAFLNSVDAIFDTIKKIMSIGMIGVNTLARVTLIIDRLKYQRKMGQLKLKNLANYYSETVKTLIDPKNNIDFDVSHRILSQMATITSEELGKAKFNHSLDAVSNIISLKLQLHSTELFLDELAVGSHAKKLPSYYVSKRDELGLELNKPIDYIDLSTLDQLKRLVIYLKNVSVPQSTRHKRDGNVPEIIFYYEQTGSLEGFENYYIHNQISNPFYNTQEVEL